MPDIFFMQISKVFIFYRLRCLPKVTLVTKPTGRSETRLISKSFNPFVLNNTEVMNHDPAVAIRMTFESIFRPPEGAKYASIK